MKIILQTIGLALAIVLSLASVAAMLYVSIWIFVGIAVVTLIYSIFNLLKAKKHLVDKSNEL